MAEDCYYIVLPVAPTALRAGRAGQAVHRLLTILPTCLRWHFAADSYRLADQRSRINDRLRHLGFGQREGRRGDGKINVHARIIRA